MEPTRQKVIGSRSPKRKMPGRGRSPRRDVRPTENAVAMIDLDPREVEPRLEAKDELHHVPLIDKERYTSIGTTMAADDTKLIHQALKKNVDLFAWTASEVPGVNPEVITHRLSVYKEARPITQKKRNHGEEKRLAVRAETEKLLTARFILEAWYTT